MKRLTAVMLALLIAMGATAAEREKSLNGEFWREQALTNIIPYWYEHVIDEEYGAFYMNLSRQWQPSPPWDKTPAMISRQVFGFSAAYLLSGDEKYLEVARKGVDYLLEHAWDKQYGGWFDELTQTGEPKDTEKKVPLQLYTNVGLALYYFVSGDERALSHIKKSIKIRRTKAHDKEFGGYFQVLNRDLSVKDDRKCKHSHFGYLGSLLPNLCMATRDSELLHWAEELAQLSIERMMDQYGWIRTNHDRQWNIIPSMSDGKEVIYSGVELTAAIVFLRLYQLTGNELYRKHGVALGEQIISCAWDSERGGWYSAIEKMPPHRPKGSLFVAWWVQCYGSFLNLQLYHVTGDNRYLNQFKKGAEFWNQYFIDREFGGIFMSVLPDSSLKDSRKAVVWRTSYHEMEHALLNYLYLNLYVNHQPVVLHFWLRDAKPLAKHFVSLVEDPSVQIAAVNINGKAWANFDAQECSVTLPEAKEIKMEVTLVPNSE